MNVHYIRDNYMTVPQAADFLSVTQTRVKQLCSEGRFIGAEKIDVIWLIPRKAVENYTRLKPGPKPKALKGGGDA